MNYITFQCSACKKSLEVPETMTGQTICCPYCESETTVPGEPLPMLPDEQTHAEELCQLDAVPKEFLGSEQVRQNEMTLKAASKVDCAFVLAITVFAAVVSVIMWAMVFNPKIDDREACAYLYILSPTSFLACLLSVCVAGILYYRSRSRMALVLWAANCSIAIPSAAYLLRYELFVLFIVLLPNPPDYLFEYDFVPLIVVVVAGWVVLWWKTFKCKIRNRPWREMLP